MADQLSRDLASLRIDRSPIERQPSKLGRLLITLLVAGGILAAFPLGKRYVEGLVFKRDVETSEIVLLSPIQSQVELTATGYVTPQVTAKVGSKIAGRIAKVFVNEGEVVQKGQVLFELDPSDERSALSFARARVLAASARVEASRAELNEVETQLAREKQLVKLGASAPATVEDRQMRVEALRKQAEAAEAEVNVSRAEANVTGQQLRNLRIFAPISGTAVTKAAQVGDVVAPTLTLVELVDFDSLLVEVDVPEARLKQVKPNGPCQLVLDSSPTENTKCKVVDFSPRVNRAKATATVKVKIVERISRLWPDMSARVSFLENEIDDNLRNQPPKKLVSKTALASFAGRQGLWTVNERKLRFSPVIVGETVGLNVEVLDGPPPGTRVVLNPEADFRNGQSVKDTKSPSDS
jgi:RND family efflux transporter MFP subunit